MNYKKSLFAEIEDLSEDKAGQVLRYVYYLKIMPQIDLDQAYFWTKIWQSKELAVENDKKKKKIIGNGDLKGLLIALNK